MKTPKPAKQPKQDKGCKDCPQAAPASTESDTATPPNAPKKPCNDCDCPEVEVEVTAPKVKLGSLICYTGAVLKVCPDKAAEMVAAGVAVKLPPSF